MSGRGLAQAGFVLAGGRSSRMGRDKALLPLEGSTLIDRIAARVLDAAGSVTIIGSPEKYGSVGYPVIPDAVLECGPLGGVYTALRSTEAEWNLIVACDMPDVTADLLKDLLAIASRSEADCVVPESVTGLDPLCAVYRRRCAGPAYAAISRKSLKMHDFVSSLHAEKWPVSEPALLANVNTPEQWSRR